MTYDYYRRVLCPLCESGEMRAVNSSLARCNGCDGTMSHSFYDAMHQIRSLPETQIQHPGENKYPEMRDPPTAS